jgi:hypothetical protein
MEIEGIGGMNQKQSNHLNMSIKKKKRQEVLDKRDSRKFFTVVGIAVLALMLLLYAIYRNM